MRNNHFKLISVLVIFFIIRPCFNTFAQQTAIKDGVVKIFYDNKLQILRDSTNATYYRVIKYRNGNIDGAITDYYKSGRLLMTGYFADNNAERGHENGKFTWYYEDGTVFQTCNYVKGFIDGAYIENYPSGLKKTCVSYTMGNRDGCEYSWDENGQASVYNKDAANCPCAIFANEIRTAPVVSGLPAHAQDDRQAILNVLDTQREAWNNGDVDGFMDTYWKSDSLVFVTKNPPMYGWRRTLEMYKKSFPNKSAMGTLTFTVIKVDVLDAKNAFVLGGWRLKRESDAPSGFFTYWFKKIDGVWVIVCDQES